MRVALVTGASRGLGLALARALSARGWALVIDARGADALDRAATELAGGAPVVALQGDVSDERHRRDLVEAAGALGDLHALVNNAGILGPSPPPRLDALELEALRSLYEVNVLAPLRLFQLSARLLARSSGCVVNVTSEAGVAAFPEWGGYGSSKAALEHISKVLTLEHARLDVYCVDPGDMNTEMEQDGFPDEDVSDRPDPAVSVPGFLELIERRPRSGRYRAQRMPVTVT